MLTWAALGTCQIARVFNVGPSTISIRSPTQLQHIFVLATKPPRISHFQQSSFKQTKNLCCFKVLRFNASLFLKKQKQKRGTKNELVKFFFARTDGTSFVTKHQSRRHHRYLIEYGFSLPSFSACLVHNAINIMTNLKEKGAKSH